MFLLFLLLQISCLGYILNKCIQKSLVWVLFFYIYFAISLSLSLLLFPQLYETHILCLCSFFSPPFVAFSFAFSISVTVSVWVCLRVCVIYIISLLQKFTLIVGTIFWHFGFTTLRAVCVAVAVAVDVVVAVFDNFFVVVQPYVKLVSLFLFVSPCVSVSPTPSPDSFSTTHSALHQVCLWQHVRFPFVCLSFSFLLLILLVLLLLREVFPIEFTVFFCSLSTL